jgi:hypothetical protein
VSAPTELELLKIQAEGSFDRRGRVIGLRGVTIACAVEGRALFIGAEVPDALASELTSTFERAPAPARPSDPPPALERCQRILEADGPPLVRSAGPSFLVGEQARFVSGVHIERSDSSSGAALRRANPGNWHPVEWDELLDGRLGPWAIATDGERVLSICHTPGPVRSRAAECGVWTDAAFRGRGHAAAVTSEWAAMMRPSGCWLFYSTDAENRSSQRVAERLQLRPLGWTWRLGRAVERDPVHPLSSISGRAPDSA